MANVQLQPGQKFAVLNNANLTAGVFTTAFMVAPGYNGGGLIGILNNTGNTINLSASVDGVNFFPSQVAGAQVSLATNTETAVNLCSALFYAFSSATNITAGTIWVGR